MRHYAEPSISPREATSSEKVLLTLLAFEEKERWTLQELAEHLGLPKSTVHRLLATLTRFQFVHQHHSGAYYFGHRVWSMGQKKRSYELLCALAQPVLHDLVRTTEESALVTVRTGLHSLCVARVDTPQDVRLRIEIGTVSPLHLGASNTVLLAFTPEQERNAILQQTVPDKDLRAGAAREASIIAARGYSYSASQLSPGVAALGVPILDWEGKLVAGLSIGAPAYRFTLERAKSMLPALRAAVSRLGEELATSATSSFETADRASMTEGGP